VDLQRSYNHSEDRFPLPERIKAFYGPFGFPDPPANRPWITSNFVMALDGRASFREIQGHTGGKEVSRSREDRWLMEFLRAHHDAQLMGANTMREEPGEVSAEKSAASGAFREKISKGWDYGIDDEELSAYREQTLKLGSVRVIILTGSGDIDLSLKVFNSLRVEPWILTTADGAQKLQSRMNAARPERAIKVVAAGKGPHVDLALAVQLLRQEHGIRTLLCEGGPTVYGELLQRRLIDEDFRTVALQLLGLSTNPQIVRPTTYGNVSYTPETAPWFQLISLHYVLPYHLFLRLRYEGPRQLS
jgi:riboflavin biosynthesis pyrimidine reductase